MNNQNLSSEKVLSKDQIRTLKGGVKAVEYCETLCMLMQNNWNNWTLEEQQSAINAWYAHCDGVVPCTVPG